MSELKTESADKRVQRSKEAVLGVTYKLLSEGGIGGVSIDEVSRRSGVSKTTIYRHWPSRSALLLDACSKIGTPPEVPDTGSLLGDVTALATHLADQLQNARWPAVLPSIIDAAERDSELAQLHAGLHGGLMRPFFAVLERAQKKGELEPRHRVSDVVAAIVGPLFYRRWFSKEPIDSHFVASVIRSIVDRTSLK
jgi:AcrR family transcriptional regulator